MVKTAKGPHRLKFAYDRSARSVDQNGYMMVKDCPISKAQVRDYYGHEIPGHDEFGLDPSRVYGVLCPAEELAKAAPTFALIPLQLHHQVDSAEEPQVDKRVGTTGENVFFDPDKGYLRATLQVTHKMGIDAIETGEAAEISAAYSYVPVKSSGTFNGKPYQFVMTDIKGNHVALVEVGRAGPDVRVLDAAPGRLPTRKKETNMDNTKPIAKRGTRGAQKRKPAARPAMDRKTIKAMLSKVVSDETINEAVEAAATELEAGAEPLPAAQAMAAVVETALEAVLEEIADPDPDNSPAVDDAELDEILAGLPEGTEEIRAAIMEYVARLRESMQPAGQDETPEEETEEERRRREAAQDAARRSKARPALDAATIQRRAEETVMSRMKASCEAADLVAPILGEKPSPFEHDAASIFKMALDKVGVSCDGIPSAAYKGMVLAYTAAWDNAPRIRSGHPLDGAFNNNTAKDSEPKVLTGAFACLGKIRKGA